MDRETDPKGREKIPQTAVPRDITCGHASSHGPARAIRLAPSAARPGHLDRAPRRSPCRSPRSRPSTSPRVASRSPARARQAVSEAAQALPGRPDRAADPRLRQHQEGRRGAGAPRSTRPRATVKGVENVAVSTRGRGRRQGRRRPADRADAARASPAAPTRRSTPRWSCARTLHIERRRQPALPIHLVGQQALWAGMQDVSKKDLEKAECAGFPIVFIILLAVFGSLAAALLPLSLGFAAVVLTGAVVFFLSQATADVGLRDQHRVDARHRRGGRLLAVHPRALPGGDARRRRSATRRARPRCARPAWPWRSPA